MRGDKLVIREEHIRAAEFIRDSLLEEITRSERLFIITIAGESGSGKSEIASAFGELLEKKDVKSVILQQDDYFSYPPKTNAEMRVSDITLVGMSEVRLELLEQNLKEIQDGNKEIEKPLVDFDNDCIERETLSLDGAGVIIVEGTYTTVLKNVHRRVFLDIDYFGTKKARERRAREEQDEFLEKILKIEHEIISTHKPMADIIIDTNYAGRMQDRTE
ncbi:uridine kinase [Fibrobacterota bacterium]